MFQKTVALLLALSISALGFTKDGTTYTTDGSQADVNNAIVDATPGDTVQIPAGTFTWGASGVGTNVNKAITLEGAGQGVTVINQASTSTTLLYVGAAAVVRGFTLNHYHQKTLIQPAGADGWRFTDMEINGALEGRIFNISNGYGLIDHCNIAWNGEQIFITGKSNAWTTGPTMGTEQAVYIEDCTFTQSSGGTGQPYTDGHRFAKAVYRFNTLHTLSKFDSHGKRSNSPDYQSSRHMEVYHNTWTSVGAGSSWSTIEHRGGSGMFFFNTGLDNTNVIRGLIKLQEYAAVQGSTWGYPGGDRFLGPDDYPIDQQIGRGKDQVLEPVYIWGNARKAPYGQPGTAVMGIISGASSITIPTQAIEEYRVRIGNPTATYTHDDIVMRFRDFYSDTPLGVSLTTQHQVFDGTVASDRSGVGIGAKTAMLAITPAQVGMGYWVTDEGDWNSEEEGPDGQLYAWSGDSWELLYTPYDYPHPLIAETEGAVVRPTHSPDTGTYTEPQEVTIATTTPGATIYYTLDGTEPNETSFTYTIPVGLVETTTLKSRAKVGDEWSATRTSVYTFDEEEPPPITLRKPVRAAGKQIRIGGKVISIGNN